MSMLGRIDVFLEVARQQSFSKAARALGVTGPAASKQVAALEAQLGVKLLTRTTRLVTLTEEGALYYERARQAIDELKEAALQVQDMKILPRGPLRISTPLSFGHAHLLPVLTQFARKYPDIRMDVQLDDRLVDIVAEGFDLAIRIGPLPDSTLIARHIADCPVLLVAAPSYLRERGAPKTPAELKHHRLIVYANAGNMLEWRYRDPAGKNGMIRHEGVFRANTAEMMLQAALDGVGIALIPYFSLAGHIKSKALEEILPGYASQAVLPIHALTPPGRYRATKVKLLLDWVVGACAGLDLVRE